MSEYLEIVALIVGSLVIAIETFIIILLYRHQKALNDHLVKSENLTRELEKNIEKHLEHLNEHSHEIEKKLEIICAPKLKETRKTIVGRSR